MRALIVDWHREWNPDKVENYLKTNGNIFCAFEPIGATGTPNPSILCFSFNVIQRRPEGTRFRRRSTILILAE